LILGWYYPKCKSCHGKKGDEWDHLCQPCQTQFFQFNFSKWSSGNPDIDNIIQSSQLNTKKPEDVIQWVSFSEFEFGDIKKVGHRKFGSIYKARWQHINFIHNFNVEVALISCNSLSYLLKEVCVY